MTPLLGTGKSLTFFYSVLLLQADSASSGILQDLCRGLQDGSQES